MEKKSNLSHLLAQHFAAARSEWAHVFSSKKKGPSSAAASERHPHHTTKDWVYATIFFAIGDEELTRNLRDSSTSATTTSAQAWQTHHANGTALMVHFESSSSSSSTSVKCLLQPGRVGSAHQVRAVF
jgi:hypothetical protein